MVARWPNRSAAAVRPPARPHPGHFPAVGLSGGGFGFGGECGQVDQLIIHGQADVLIPASDGRELYRCSAAPDKRLVLILGAGHNDLMMMGMVQYFEALRAFVYV